MKFTKGANARCTVMLSTEVVGLIADGSGRVNGVKYRSLSEDKDKAVGSTSNVSVLHGANVILATGSFRLKLTLFYFLLLRLIRITNTVFNTLKIPF